MLAGVTRQDCYGSANVQDRWTDCYSRKSLLEWPFTEPVASRIKVVLRLVRANFGPRNETMSSTGTVTGAWHPKAESEKELVRWQLEKIVSDGRFAASKRYQYFLRYIVEQTLAENEDGLKERTLRVEVFHRGVELRIPSGSPVERLCAR